MAAVESERRRERADHAQELQNAILLGIRQCVEHVLPADSDRVAIVEVEPDLEVHKGLRSIGRGVAGVAGTEQAAGGFPAAITVGADVAGKKLSTLVAQGQVRSLLGHLILQVEDA